MSTDERLNKVEEELETTKKRFLVLLKVVVQLIETSDIDNDKLISDLFASLG